MDVRSSVDADRTTISVTGEIDIATADRLWAECAECLAGVGVESLVLDLSGVSFIDSSGLSALIRLRNAALDKHVRLMLKNPSDRVREVLRLTGMDSVFDATSL